MAGALLVTEAVRLTGNRVHAARGAGVLITGSTSCATTDVVRANSLIDVAIRENRIEAQAPGHRRAGGSRERRRRANVLGEHAGDPPGPRRRDDRRAARHLRLVAGLRWVNGQCRDRLGLTSRREFRSTG